jgi:hypothetical protein
MVWHLHPSEFSELKKKYGTDNRGKLLIKRIPQKEIENICKKVWNAKYKRSVPNWKRGKYNQSRYTGFNLHSLYYRGTIELRHHSGTINAQKIINWINLNLAILDYASKRFNEKELMELMNQKSFVRKLQGFYDLLRLGKPLRSYITQRVKKFNYGLSAKGKPLAEESD